MNWSKWKSPLNIQYWTDDGIEFTDGDSVLDQTVNLSSQGLLYAVSQNYNTTVNVYGSRGLVFTEFGFEPRAIAAVQVEITASRLSRIADSVVQLYNSQPIGRNVADADLENHKVYDGDLGGFWRVPNLIANADFGVLLDFAPRSDMPSSNTLIIRSVQMRVSYA